MKLIVGLGNPGKKYQKTRHNVGFLAISKLKSKISKLQLKTQNFKFDKKFGAEIIKIDDLILAKPQTYMNKSGEAVVKLVNYFKVNPSNLIIICDDIDLPLGTIRIRSEGSSGGQKGLESIIQNLNTDQFARIRIGIGSNQNMSAEDYVLQKFTKEEEVIVKRSVDEAVKIVLEFIKTGIVREDTYKV